MPGRYYELVIWNIVVIKPLQVGFIYGFGPFRYFERWGDESGLPCSAYLTRAS